MAINFGAEYRRFNKEMEKKHRLYAQLEMTQEQIDALDAFDKEEFLSNNNYKRHVLSLDIDENTDAPDNCLLFGNCLFIVLRLLLCFCQLLRIGIFLLFELCHEGFQFPLLGLILILQSKQTVHLI